MIQTIYINWFQGFEHAPDIVTQCVRSWKFYNPDWNIILLDDTNIHTYVRLEDYIDLSKIQLSPQKKANILRCILLHKYGGVWADATTFCNAPLQTWLPKYIREGFFAFRNPGPDRMLSNWFLYASPNNYIVTKWMNHTIQFHKKGRSTYPYFIHHYLFAELYKSDSAYKRMWDKVPLFDANGSGPHYIQLKGMFSTLTPQVQSDILRKITPLFKLTHKEVFPPYDTSKTVYFLYSTVPTQGHQ